MTIETPARERLLCTVIRHVEIEDLGYLGDALISHGLRFRYADADALAEHAMEETEEDDGLIVLGGPMSAYENDRYPFLDTVVERIRRQLDAGRPVLGICLGAQLLAAAAGARVYRGADGKEIGWGEVELTDAGAADRLWAGFPRRFNTFHWHGDTFELPAAAEALARSIRYVQAFRIGRLAYGVQFHPEVVPSQLEAWIRAYRLELERERLRPDTVLHVPDKRGHRDLALQFGANIARWLVTARAAC